MAVLFIYRALIVLPAVCLGLLALLFISDSNERVFFFINQTILPNNSAIWDIFWQNVTFLGDSLAVVAILLPFAVGRPALVKAVFYTIVSTTLIVQLIKIGLHLPRPVMVLGIENIHVIGDVIQRRSFPSGHTAAAFALVSILLRYFCLNTVKATALVSAAVIVGISRVVVGAHWPMDILAGAVIGWLCGYLCICWVSHTPSDACRWGYRVGLWVLFAATVYLLVKHPTGYTQAMGLQMLLASTSLLLSGWLWHKKRA